MFSKIARFCKEISQDTLVSKKHHHSYLSAPFFSNVGRAFSSETLEFTVKRQEVIVPSPLSPPHVVALTNNDQIMPPFITGFYYFFQAPPSGPPPSAPLTQSLARALAAFPPAAGRFKPRSNGAGIDVECNNQGALFVEAHTTATLQDLLTTGPLLQNNSYSFPTHYIFLPCPSKVSTKLFSILLHCTVEFGTPTNSHGDPFLGHT
jgi:hypothetical protein